jgi:hypothetical protein
MLPQARGEKGEGSPAAVVNITRRALAGLRRIRAIRDQSVPRPGPEQMLRVPEFLGDGEVTSL